ncbi:MAG: hypothetical protein A2146_04305 [Actinobacteria bacterium RBG_16_67_10]|nr:MAG: hypothetical protein A2146_04305 [Actinobacteria bacterium RBG_16_67_10]
MPILPALAVVMALGASPAPRVVDLPMPPMLAFPAEAPPVIDAAAWIVWSVDQNAELGSFNADDVRAPASITKLMTAMLVVENAAPAETVTISARAGSTPVGYVGQPQLRQGEVWTVRDLLANILVQSGNDAAVALAEHVAGSVEAFVAMMNARASELGMTSTVFVTPNGLDAEGHVMSARDIVAMGEASLAYPDILRMTRVKRITFDVGGRHIEVDATNRDLGVFPGLFGLKTGDTIGAGQTLLAYDVAQHGSLLSVVLGSAGRLGATRELLAWAWSALGPRDYFFAPVVGTDLELLFPDWYVTRLRAAGALPTGDPVAPEATPLSDAVNSRLRGLLPALLGGDGS